MAHIFDKKSQTDPSGFRRHHPGVYNKADLEQYHQANRAIEDNRHRIEDTEKEIEELKQTGAVELFQKQIALLQKRLINDPKFFQQMFIAEGTNAIAWEFQQEELSESFTHTLWELLLRFLWNVPLKFKRKFVRRPVLGRPLEHGIPIGQIPIDGTDESPFELKRYVPEES